MREHAFLRFGRALGGEDHIFTHVVERQADLLLAVGVGVGRVEIVDAALIGRADQRRAFFQTPALYGQAAHGGLGDHQSGLSQSDLFHTLSPFRIPQANVRPLPVQNSIIRKSVYAAALPQENTP